MALLLGGQLSAGFAFYDDLGTVLAPFLLRLEIPLFCFCLSLRSQSGPLSLVLSECGTG